MKPFVCGKENRKQKTVQMKDIKALFYNPSSWHLKRKERLPGTGLEGEKAGAVIGSAPPCLSVRLFVWTAFSFLMRCFGGNGSGRRARREVPQIT